MADRELKIRFVVDDDGAVRKIEGVDEALKDVGSSSEGTSRAIQSLNEALLS